MNNNLQSKQMFYKLTILKHLFALLYEDFITVSHNIVYNLHCLLHYYRDIHYFCFEKLF